MKQDKENIDLQGQKEGNSKIRIILVVFAIVCFAIAAFIIYNTMFAKNDAGTNVQPEKPLFADDDPINKTVDFKALQKQNPDIYAWITVPGTAVNYPIVQSPTDDFYYLRRNIDGQSSTGGSLYTEMANKKDFSDPVTVIYGHNLTDGSMFSSLHNFENKDFFDSHEYFYVYTPEKNYRLRIDSAYIWNNRHILNSYNFKDPAVVQDYFKQVLHPDSISYLVREGVSLSSSDRIVQLSTCVDSIATSTQRYIVTGQIVEEKNN